MPTTMATSTSLTSNGTFPDDMDSPRGTYVSFDPADIPGILAKHASSNNKDGQSPIH